MTTLTSSHGDLSLEAGEGWAFCPGERQLTDLYLHRKINDVPLPGDTGSFIHVADVYSAEPEKLVERLHRAPGTGKGDVHKMPVWYFFSPVRYVGGRKTNARGEPGRKSRTIKGAAGTGKHWHSEKGERPVKGGSDYGGHKQYFSYKVKNPSSGKDERGGWIMWEYSISPDHGGGDLVLCKIYPSFHAVAAGETVSDPIVNPNKRKAPAGGHPEDPTASAQRRLTDEHPVLVEGLESDLTWVDGSVLDQDAMTEWYGAASLTDHQSTYQAAPPCQNVEQDFWSEYHNDDLVVPEGDLPCAPAPQPEPEEDDAGILQQTVTGDENCNYNDVTPPVDEDETARPEDLMADFQMNFPQLFVTEEPEMMYDAAGLADQAVPLSNFFENVEQDFWSEYQNQAWS
ncbi:hypothetical protein ACQ4PT_034864 [Festuca glaucescens]